MENTYLDQANYFMEESGLTVSESTEAKEETKEEVIQEAEVIEEKKEEKKEMDAETKKKVTALRKERDKLNDQIKKLTGGKDVKDGKLY